MRVKSFFRNPENVPTFIIAGLALLVIIGLVFTSGGHWLSTASDTPAPWSENSSLEGLERRLNTSSVVVPNSTIPAGTKINGKTLLAIRSDSHAIGRGDPIRSVREADQLYARVDLPANRPIMRSSLSSVVPGNPVNGTAPPGYQAISLNVPDRTITRWATPGMRADLSFKVEVNGASHTDPAAENAVILRVQPAQAENGQKPEGYRVTIGVLLADFQKVSEKVKLGTAILTPRQTRMIL